ncbi:MAG: DUF5107 domain-containing protein [Armatimonadetes bacterium]|nr:DUF5107 domain-containing protein [Armatimonadota bacterium]
MRNLSWREETISLLSYSIGHPSPFPEWRRKQPFSTYPYPMLDDLGNQQPEIRSYHTVVVENGKLRLVILPELGGKLHSIQDLETGTQFLYTNPVVRYGLVALRGAWLSGGIEWSCPIGHHVNTVSKVWWNVLEAPAGPHKAAGITVQVGATDLHSGIQWAVGMTLRSMEYRVITSISILNTTPYPYPVMFWSNAAFPASPGFEFICTAKQVRTSGGAVAGEPPGTLLNFPHHNGLAISFWKNIDHAADLFAVNPGNDWFGGYDHNRDFGILNLADRRKSPGQKLWTWGVGDDGRIWEDLLTDGAGPYVELQRGSVVDQSTFHLMPPGGVKRWNEVWLPFSGIGRPVQATEFHVTGESGNVQSAPQNNRPVITRKSYSSKPADEPLLNPIASSDISPARPITIQARLKSLMKEGQLDQAERACRNAIDQGSRSVIPYVTLAWLVGCKGDYQSMNRLAEEAIGISNKNDLARYLRCLSLPRIPDDAEALIRSCRYGIALRINRASPAQRPYETREDMGWILKRTPDHPIARLIIAVTSRIEGDQARALDHLNRLEKTGLYGLFIAIERRFLISKTLTSGLIMRMDRSPVELYSIAQTYLALGLIEEAGILMQWLAERGGGQEAQYWASRITGNLFQQFPANSDLHLFPLNVDPINYDDNMSGHDQSPQYRYCELYRKGVLAYNRGRPLEAVRQWEIAINQGATDAFISRNLAWAYWHDMKFPAGGDQEMTEAMPKPRNQYHEAAQHIMYAIALMPLEYRLYLEQDDLWREMGCTPIERLQAFQFASDAVLCHWQIRARMVEILVDAGEFDRAIEMLNSGRYLPWEGERKMRLHYLLAHAERGRSRLKSSDIPGAINDFEALIEYPKNLGIGRPAPPYRNEALEHWYAGIAAWLKCDSDLAAERWRTSLIHWATHHWSLQSPNFEIAFEHFMNHLSHDERFSQIAGGYEALIGHNLDQAAERFLEAAENCHVSIWLD